MTYADFIIGLLLLSLGAVFGMATLALLISGRKNDEIDRKLFDNTPCKSGACLLTGQFDAQCRHAFKPGSLNETP